MSAGDVDMMQKNDPESTVAWSEYESLHDDHLKLVFTNTTDAIEQDVQNMQLKLNDMDTTVNDIQTQVIDIQTSIEMLT
jgi:hypothetical protein